MSSTTIGKRLGRLEGLTTQIPQRVESWLTNGSVSTNRITGEIITKAELKARPLPSGTLRIVRNIIDPNLEE